MSTLTGKSHCRNYYRPGGGGGAVRSSSREYICIGHYPPQHTMDFNKEEMTLVAAGTTVPMLNIDNNVWFRGNDCAAVLDYKDPKRAIKRHVDPEWQQTLGTLLQKGGTRSTHLEKYNLNDLNARWVSEPGLYDLASSSKLPAARAFRKWVFGEILPSIRSTGSYSTQAAAPAAKQTDTWLDKRLEGKELMRLKNASLQELIAGGFEQTGCKLYAIAANHINQVHTDHDQLQKAAAIAMACQHSRHIEHAGTSGQVLCRDMLSEVCQRQPAAPERTVRGRPDQGVCWAQAEPEARLCVYWHGGSTEQAVDSSRGKEAQG